MLIYNRSQRQVIKLCQKLSYKNYGIYVAQCSICRMAYVGQIKNSFSLRWNTLRAVWKQFDLSDANANPLCYVTTLSTTNTP